jgi:hypothetical protein
MTLSQLVIRLPHPLPNDLKLFAVLFGSEGGYAERHIAVAKKRATIMSHLPEMWRLPLEHAIATT